MRKVLTVGIEKNNMCSLATGSQLEIANPATNLKGSVNNSPN